MVTEQDKTLEALQAAIQMEIDGKEYYLKASRKSSHELGRKLLRSLADEEDVHQQKFAEIFDAIRSHQGWPRTSFQPDGGRGLRTIFAQATESMDSNIQKAGETELSTIQEAMVMENKTYDFYIDRSKNAAFDTEKAFYNALAAQEKEHHLVLLDYYEYLEDPAAWFVKKEHPSLDGG